MEVVRQALAELVARPEVAGAALLSREGLVVASDLDSSTDPEAVAALGIALARTGEQFAAAAGRAPPERLVLESPDGMMLTCPLADGALLLVLAAPDAPVGQLTYALRQMRGDLAALLYPDVRPCLRGRR
jgi:predicted regulator of Ras-like GTPase activity (Roadblock/LC7/MglB family)